MDGSFVPSSGRMTGSYRERKYTYQVEQIELVNGDTVKGRKADTDDLRHSHDIFFKVSGGHLKDEEAYRHIYGPFESQADMEAAIEDMMLYGSP
jgi:hypothetical protein